MKVKVAFLVAVLAAVGFGASAVRPPLRVCSDPNNLPYSNGRGEGFENRIAHLLARNLGRPLQYTWWAQRRGFIRNTIGAGRCDLIVGAPRGLDGVSTTQPYYRSTYVFVTRKESDLHIRSFDDPRLRRLHIGVQLIGDDGANSPPAHALGRRGIVQNVVGYTVYGDYGEPTPTARIVRAVASGDVDVALVWGPQAGFFSRQSTVPLELTAIDEDADGSLPLAFDISMAVRRGDAGLLAALDRFISSHRADIGRILDDYGVPRRKVTT
jgi:mxaJ protein